MSMYPEGSDNASAPWNQVEAEMIMDCEACGAEKVEFAGTYQDKYTFAGSCPECHVEVEVDLYTGPD
jgi:hypothetical protein